MRGRIKSKTILAVFLTGLFTFVQLMFGFTGIAAAAAPTIVITSPTASANLGTSFAVNGTATANTAISVQINGTTVGNTTADGSGNWSVNVTGQTAGAKTITATASGDLMAYLSDLGNTNLGIVNITQGSFSLIAGSTGSGSQDAVPHSNGKVYTLNSQLFGTNNKVSMFNGDPLAFNSDIPLNDPLSSVLLESINKLYVTDANDNNVQVIDTTTDTVVTTIPVGSAPQGIAKSPDGSKVYVANGSGSSVSVIDTSTDTVIQTPSTCAGGFNLTISPDGTMLYVLCQGTGIQKFDTATFTLQGTAAFTDNLLIMAINSSGSKLYVSDSQVGGLAIIDTAAMTVTTGYGSAFISAMKVIGNNLYLVDLGNLVFQVYDTTTDVQVGSNISLAGMTQPFVFTDNFMIQPSTSASVAVTVASATSPSLAATGQNNSLYTLIATMAIGAGLTLLYRHKQRI